MKPKTIIISDFIRKFFEDDRENKIFAIDQNGIWHDKKLPGGEVWTSCLLPFKDMPKEIQEQIYEDIQQLRDKYFHKEVTK